MIAIEGVSHRIGAAEILAPTTLALPRGAMTALIGPNGAGKSTLLSLIGRIEPLRTGRITIDGMDVTRSDGSALARRMAFLGQSQMQGSRLRVRELVGFGRWPHHQGRPKPEDHAAVAAALTAFDLDTLAGRFLDELSGGQCQRAFLAMTFAQGTDWLLLDEPLNNLDLAHARALMARLRGLVRDAGKSVVVVLHDLNHAAAWADHIVAMKAGRVVAEGPPADVLTPETLHALYDTEVRVIELEGRPLVLHHI